MSTPARSYYPDEPAPDYCGDEPPPAYEPEYTQPANLAWLDGLKRKNPTHKEEQSMSQPAHRAAPRPRLSLVPMPKALPAPATPEPRRDPAIAAHAFFQINECAARIPAACCDALRECNRAQRLKLGPALYVIERNARRARLELSRQEKQPLVEVPRLFDDDGFPI